MADKKISQLTSQTSVAAEDLLLVIDDPNGTPTSKKMTIKAFLSRLPANTVFTANVTVSGNKTLITSNAVFTKSTTVNTFNITLGSTPASNNATTVGMSVGQMRFTNTYLYIAVNATTIKRVALGTF